MWKFVSNPADLDFNWNDEEKKKKIGRQSSHISINPCYIYLIFHILSCFRVKIDISKVSDALIFQNSQQITRKCVSNLQIWCNQIAMTNQKTKTANLVIISIKLFYILPCFISFCIILGAKWTFLSYQVIAVLNLHVEINKRVLYGRQTTQ